VKFNDYLKACRARYDLTQERLVRELYAYDDAFSGLDVRTLSRWETAQTQPPMAKQVLIVRFFRRYSSHLFPCFYGRERIEDELCRAGIYNLLGKSKSHIFNLPENSFEIDNTVIRHVRSYDDIDAVLKVPHAITEAITERFYAITPGMLKAWALHPGSLFLFAENATQILGMLTVLRLKPERFDEVLAFDKAIVTLDEKDFAGPEEEACLLLLPSYAYNEQVASLLLLRFYAHLIAHQDLIREVGGPAVLDGGRKLAQKMHLEHTSDKEIAGRRVSAYRASLERMLINEAVLRMIFQKEECPEESS
jgi:transcriptional regulator with XRE-family HTH domain